MAGDPVGLPPSARQSVGLTRDIPSAAAVVGDLVATAAETIRRLDGPVEACGWALPSHAIAASKAL
jgi:hypothetical protein